MKVVRLTSRVELRRALHELKMMRMDGNLGYRWHILNSGSSWERRIHYSHYCSILWLMMWQVSHSLTLKRLCLQFWMNHRTHAQNRITFRRECLFNSGSGMSYLTRAAYRRFSNYLLFSLTCSRWSVLFVFGWKFHFIKGSVLDYWSSLFRVHTVLHQYQLPCPITYFIPMKPTNQDCLTLWEAVLHLIVLLESLVVIPFSFMASGFLSLTRINSIYCL